MQTKTVRYYLISIRWTKIRKLASTIRLWNSKGSSPELFVGVKIVASVLKGNLLVLSEVTMCVNFYLSLNCLRNSDTGPVKEESCYQRRMFTSERLTCRAWQTFVYQPFAFIIFL